MSTLIDRIAADYNSRSGRSLEVPEWDVTIYAKNFNLKDRAALNKKVSALAKDGEEPDSNDNLVYAIVAGALDEHGEPLFGKGDAIKLKHNARPEVVTRVGLFVLGLDETDKEREKN